MNTIFVTLLSLAATSDNPDGTKLAPFLAAACRQSRDSIATIHASVDTYTSDDATSPHGGKSHPFRGYEWWQSGVVIRRQSRADRNEVAVLHRDGITKMLNTNALNKGKIMYSGTLTPLTEAESNSPFWMDALYAIQSSPFSPAYRVFDADKFDRITMEMTDGRKLYRVDSHLPNIPRCTVWLDPSRNYLPIKWELTFGTGGNPIVSEAGTIEEVQPGCYFPTETYVKKLDHGQWVVWKKSVIRIVSINKPISPDVFELRFPPGTSVGDLMTGTTYLADDSEMPRNGNAAPLPDGRRESASATLSESSPVHRLAALALAVAVGLASLLTVYILVRRRKG